MHRIRDVIIIAFCIFAIVLLIDIADNIRFIAYDVRML